jgi:hypothetical protein
LLQPLFSCWSPCQFSIMIIYIFCLKQVVNETTNPLDTTVNECLEIKSTPLFPISFEDLIKSTCSKNYYNLILRIYINNVLLHAKVNSLVCLPLYSTSTKGLDEPQATQIGFKSPFNLLCLAAVESFFQSNFLKLF